MSKRRADPGVQERPSWSARSRIGALLASVGILLFVSGQVIGSSERGFSVATSLHVLGVLALIVAAVLAAPALRTLWREDARGKPLVGLLAIGVLVPTGWLVPRLIAESAAAARWNDLAALAGSDDSAHMITRFDEADLPALQDPELRMRIVVRLGELRDVRARPLLERIMTGHEEADLRRAAAESYGALVDPTRIDPLIRLLAAAQREGDEWELLRIALRRATGHDLGAAEEWIEWRLTDLLASGTPEDVETILRWLARVDESIYQVHVKRLKALRAPALRSTFEADLKKTLESGRDRSIRAASADVLGEIGDPASVRPILGLLRRVRGMMDRGKMAASAGRHFSRLLGRALRSIAGGDVLDDARWAPVFEAFVRLLGDSSDSTQDFAVAELNRMSGGANHGRDAAAWKRWREDATIDAWVAKGDLGKLTVELQKRVREGEVELAARAIRALARIEDDRAVAALRGVARRTSALPSIRTIAIDELAGRESGITQEDFLPILEDEENVEVLRAAIRALGTIDEDPVAEALHDRYLIEEKGDLRGAILSALREMTVDAVFGALVDAVRDEDVGIAQVAADELEKRTGKRFGVDPEKWEAWYAETFGK